MFSHSLPGPWTASLIVSTNSQIPSKSEGGSGDSQSAISKPKTQHCAVRLNWSTVLSSKQKTKTILRRKTSKCLAMLMTGRSTHSRSLKWSRRHRRSRKTGWMRWTRLQLTTQTTHSSASSPPSKSTPSILSQNPVSTPLFVQPRRPLNCIASKISTLKLYRILLNWTWASTSLCARATLKFWTTFRATSSFCSTTLTLAC